MVDANTLMARRTAASQSQFLNVTTAEEALQRFRAALQPVPALQMCPTSSRSKPSSLLLTGT